MAVATAPPTVLDAAEWCLRPLDGWDELWLAEQSAMTGWRLVDRMLHPAVDRDRLDSLTVGGAEDLTLGLYRTLYGDAAECRADCPCGERSSIDVDIAEFQARLAPPGGPWSSAPLETADGGTIRLPTIGELRDHPDPVELLGRLVDDERLVDTETADELLSRASGVIDAVLAAACPACGQTVRVHFALAEFLRRRIETELPLLHRETHLLASAYHWSRDVILSLPRSTRQTYAGFVLHDRGARR